MSKVKVYDKISWHFPEGNNCPNIGSAKRHFIVIMEWLNKNNLLTDEGKEIYELGIDDDFSITSSMLTKKGNLLFQTHYSKWLRKINYKTNPDTNELDSFLSEK